MAADDTATTQLTVTGMTCGHCVTSVTEEISEEPGVQHVGVVLETGAVTVTSTVPLDLAAVAAGYAVA